MPRMHGENRQSYGARQLAQTLLPKPAPAAANSVATEIACPCDRCAWDRIPPFGHYHSPEERARQLRLFNSQYQGKRK
jgi:hypothetical protein